MLKKNTMQRHPTLKQNPPPKIILIYIYFLHYQIFFFIINYYEKQTNKQTIAPPLSLVLEPYFPFFLSPQ